MTRRVYKGQHISASGTEILRDGALAVDLTTNSLYIHDGVTPVQVAYRIQILTGSGSAPYDNNLVVIEKLL